MKIYVDTLTVLVLEFPPDLVVASPSLITVVPPIIKFQPVSSYQLSEYVCQSNLLYKLLAPDWGHYGL